MFTSAISNADESPPNINEPMPPSPFFSLPMDIVWQILARVPKRSYPILSCVSKNLCHLVRSPAIHKIRSLLGKDSIYICFIHKTNRAQNPKWFTFRRNENNPKENQFVSVDILFPYHHEPNPSIIAIGSEMFFICGSYIPSSTVWIFNSKSCEFRRGPSMKVNRLYKSVGLVGSKIYVVGGYRGDEIKAESFDLKTQTWEQAPSPKEESSSLWISSATVSLDRKVCVLSVLGAVAVCYDTRDGSCDDLKLPIDKWWETGLCVIDNVLYVYYARSGLMWYDSELRLWRNVNGLDDLDTVRSVGMAEYYGNLAFLWKESSDDSAEMKTIWCRLIALDRSDAGIYGTAELPQLLGSVPRGFRLHHCLSVSE